MDCAAIVRTQDAGKTCAKHQAGVKLSMTKNRVPHNRAIKHVRERDDEREREREKRKEREKREGEPKFNKL